MNDVERLVLHVRKVLGDLTRPQPEGEYQYSSLALCVVDAVYSIGVRYESTWRTVSDFARRQCWEVDRKKASREYEVTDLLSILRPYEHRWEQMAIEVFRNSQRTSSRSGILKAEAVYRFAQVLYSFGIETFSDALRLGLRDEVKNAIAAIPGQGSGISYSYFLILAGHPDAVKPDRMVSRFVAKALGLRNVTQQQCENLVRQACLLLRPEYPKLTASLLDHAIWEYQRKQRDAQSASKCRLALS
jgi:hypothetical protein